MKNKKFEMKEEGEKENRLPPPIQKTINDNCSGHVSMANS